MTTRASILAAACLVLAFAAGCSTNTELGGVEVPNANPDTRITGQPPTLLEASYSVRFYWTGTDPDGRIKGYQWKISDNGRDGISPRDTLTHDPVTGAEINPWRFTTTTDSIFVVLADQPGFPGDNPNDPRSYRSHTIFVRAMDEDGAVDPSPAHISFTSTTIVPTARVLYPRLDQGEAQRAPATINIGWDGYDEDLDNHLPTRVRYLWREAVAEDGTLIDVWDRYRTYYDELINFDSPDWSAWFAYDPMEENRQVSFPNLPIGGYYLFAVQVADTAGAVSVGRGYQEQVAHLFTATGFKPLINMQEPFIAGLRHNLDIQIAAGQPLNFSWTVDASSYNGNIVSMQHGWDLLSPDDPADDPRWSVPPGTAEANRIAEEQTYQNGAHTFWLRVIDDSNQVTIFRLNLEVIEYVDYEQQAELLVIDQVIDTNSTDWRDCENRFADWGFYRNAFWQFLENGPGGVSGLVWDSEEDDWRDDGEIVIYSDIVGYKAVLCYAYSAFSQSMFQNFRPDAAGDKYVWLRPYQERGGNLFLVGANSMLSFLRTHNYPAYMLPIIFTSTERNWVAQNAQTFTTGFGETELTDGTEVPRGPTMYPYLVAGISALSFTAPANQNIYGVAQPAANAMRRTDCVGLKGLVLDDAFRNEHAIGPGVVADTIMTNPCIDWRDRAADSRGELGIVTNGFLWRDDEFVDADISQRGTQFQKQVCDDAEQGSPDGMCIEPMWRGYARFDWLREYKRAQGDPFWPNSGTDPAYSPDALDDTCGQSGSYALTSWYDTAADSILIRGSARTNGQVFGYFSYKMTADKPSGKADVFWGFDPYRFDHEEMKKAVRWVLGSHFGLQVLAN